MNRKVETRKRKKKQTKNKDGFWWFELASPEYCGWWAGAACPEGWWVIQIPYALWHMLLCCEKQRSVRGGGVAQRGGGGVLSFISQQMVRRGVDAITHTLQNDTTPSSWRQRESTERKWGEQRTQRQETKCKARQVLESLEKHAWKLYEAVGVCFSGSTDRLSGWQEKHIPHSSSTTLDLGVQRYTY